ncbi:MAG TPA: hypothetical protein VNE58_00835 [Casimicrobiaceae bacterium]|nr:hypothetical protein [Casimicrobiaceae bacterium]
MESSPPIKARDHLNRRTKFLLQSRRAVLALEHVAHCGPRVAFDAAQHGPTDRTEACE